MAFLQGTTEFQRQSAFYDCARPLDRLGVLHRSAAELHHDHCGKFLRGRGKGRRSRVEQGSSTRVEQRFSAALKDSACVRALAPEVFRILPERLKPPLKMVLPMQG